MAATAADSVALDPIHGVESPRTIAFIDENWCIGCTLCIKACPTDAIMGSNKLMHTVIEAYCTGCELCLPVCPVVGAYVSRVLALPGVQDWITGALAEKDFLDFEEPYRLQR